MKYTLDKHAKHGYYFANPKPTIEEVNKFYEEEFYSSNYGKFNDSELTIQKEELQFFESNWSRVLTILNMNIKDNAHKSMFDIGFGYGLTLDYFSENGYEVSGLEPSSSGYTYALNKGYNVFNSGVEGYLDQVDVKVGVVTLFNVLEHLREPENVLNQIRDNLLLDNGLIVIDVPNEFNDFQVIANEENNLNDWWVCPPNHINYFNASSLISLVESAGFDIIDTYASFPLELFMLMGDVYVGNEDIGKKCHNKRVNFEKLMIEHGKYDKMMDLYRAFSKLDIGRQVTLIARKKSDN